MEHRFSQKPPVTQFVKKFSAFYVTLAYSDDPAIVPYLEPDESSLHSPPYSIPF
jgi:hypothetical protein